MNKVMETASASSVLSCEALSWVHCYLNALGLINPHCFFGFFFLVYLFVSALFFFIIHLLWRRADKAIAGNSSF